MKGVYTLVIQVSRDVQLDVGALGKLHFKKGFYAYVGSAQNSIETRMKRHFRKEKRKFWHIDYLLEHRDAKIIKTYSFEAEKACECKIARELGKDCEPVAGFGCSDCKCKSHLVRLSKYESPGDLPEKAGPER